MKTLALDSNNDISFNSLGNFYFLEDIEALKQTIQNVVLTNYGEIILNNELGVDYFNTVFSPQPDLFKFKKQVINQTEQVEGVVNVSGFDMQVNGDTLNYTMTVVTIYGDITING